MNIRPEIKVMLADATGQGQMISSTPFSLVGLMNLLFDYPDLAGEVSSNSSVLSSLLWAEIGDVRLSHSELISDGDMLDACDPEMQMGLLSGIAKRCVPGYVEAEADRLTHLTADEREAFQQILIGSEAQVKQARLMFLRNYRRRVGYKVIDLCFKDLATLGGQPEVRDAAAFFLTQVPKCSAFWIGRPTMDDVCGAIMKHISGNHPGSEHDMVGALAMQLRDASGIAQ